MTENSRDRELQISDQLHPWVYRAIVGLALLLLLSVWGFFGSGNSGLALTVVSAFIVIAVAIPAVLWRIWRKSRGLREEPKHPASFPAWRERDLAIDQGRLKGSLAAIEILLPITAVAFGMAIFALVLHFDIGG